jgi:hypothetical protein
VLFRSQCLMIAMAIGRPVQPLNNEPRNPLSFGDSGGPEVQPKQSEPVQPMNTDQKVGSDPAPQ